MKLKFYKTGFKLEQNGVYEELATYLSTLTPKHSFTDVKSFGYFHLDETVKLPLDSHAFSFTGADLGDYCVAIDDAAEYPATYYYFVRGIS